MRRVLRALTQPRAVAQYARQRVRSRIIRTRFRFWLYPAYWRLVLGTGGLSGGSASEQRRFMVAIPNQDAGIGHQLGNWIAGLLYADRHRLTYAPHPLNPPDWDRFLGLSEYSARYRDVTGDRRIRHVQLPFVRGPDDVIGLEIMWRIVTGLDSEDGVAFYLERDQSVHDQTTAAGTLRARYAAARAGSPIASVFDDGRVGVAVHVRRGDVSMMRLRDSGNWRQRWLKDEYFVSVVKGLAGKFGSDALDVHVFSQGDPSQFSAFESLPNAHLHLDEDVFWTFHQLVEADILVMSPSSFSYVAGIISTGAKVARFPWWHHLPDSDGWFQSDDSGVFPAGAVSDALRASKRVAGGGGK